jgi:hypothetical protein
MLQEWSITDTLDSNGSLSKLGIPLSATSKYVTYWPSIIYKHQLAIYKKSSCITAGTTRLQDTRRSREVHLWRSRFKQTIRMAAIIFFINKMTVR